MLYTVLLWFNTKGTCTCIEHIEYEKMSSGFWSSALSQMGALRLHIHAVVHENTLYDGSI